VVSLLQRWPCFGAGPAAARWVRGRSCSHSRPLRPPHHNCALAVTRPPGCSAWGPRMRAGERGRRVPPGAAAWGRPATCRNPIWSPRAGECGRRVPLRVLVLVRLRARAAGRRRRARRGRRRLGAPGAARPPRPSTAAPGSTAGGLITSRPRTARSRAALLARRRRACAAAGGPPVPGRPCECAPPGSHGGARRAVGRGRAAPAPIRLERLPAAVRRRAARRAAAAGCAELPCVRRQRGRLRADPAPALGAQGAPPRALGRPQSVGRCGALRAERQRTAPSSALACIGRGRLPPQRGWASFLQLRLGC